MRWKICLKGRRDGASLNHSENRAVIAAVEPRAAQRMRGECLAAAGRARGARGSFDPAQADISLESADNYPLPVIQIT